MPQDKPIKVVAIEWQKHYEEDLYHGTIDDGIAGIRLVLSNGQKSPAFFA